MSPLPHAIRVQSGIDRALSMQRGYVKRRRASLHAAVLQRLPVCRVHERNEIGISDPSIQDAIKKIVTHVLMF